MKSVAAGLLTVLWVLGMSRAVGAPIDASEPQGVTVYAYDDGRALIHERRRVNLARGESRVRFTRLPTTLDPLSVSIITPSERADFESEKYIFAYDMKSLDRMLLKYRDKTVTVNLQETSYTGVLLTSMDTIGGDGRSEPQTLILKTDDETTQAIPASAILSIAFPAHGDIYRTPTLLWEVRSGQDAPYNLRLSYMAERFYWQAAYEMILDESRKNAFLSGRVSLQNDTGIAYENARIRLLSTGQHYAESMNGQGADRQTGFKGYRYHYGKNVLEPETGSMGKLAASQYDVDGQHQIYPGQELNIQFIMADDIPVTHFYVYDGALFDRFRRNRRNDWNYGTEYHRRIDQFLEFENSAGAGLGKPLPAGVFRLFVREEEDRVDMIGEDRLSASEVGSFGSVRLGAARDLKGERERTGYREVTPLHQYEESFEIRLENTGTEDVEVRVVEHLYRWHEYEIVKADHEYRETHKQTIEFRPLMKAGSTRSIQYTVRYSW